MAVKSPRGRRQIMLISPDIITSKRSALVAVAAVTVFPTVYPFVRRRGVAGKCVGS